MAHSFLFWVTSSKTISKVFLCFIKINLIDFDIKLIKKFMLIISFLDFEIISVYK